MMMKGLVATFLAFGIHAGAYAAGALAIDSNQGSRYGFAYGYSNFGEASSRALNECGGNCQIVQTFADTCAAYAADQTPGSTVYGWGTAGNAGQAQSSALQYCQSYGGRSCIVRVWGCDE